MSCRQFILASLSLLSIIASIKLSFPLIKGSIPRTVIFSCDFWSYTAVFVEGSFEQN